MDFSLSGIIHTVGQWLLTPCRVVLILLMVVTVWQIEDLAVEFFVEHRRLKADIPILLKRIHSDREKGLTVLIQESKLLQRRKKHF